MKFGEVRAPTPRQIPVGCEVERMLVAAGAGRAVVLEVSGANLEAQMMYDSSLLHTFVDDWCPDEEGIRVWEGVPEARWHSEECGTRTEFDGYKFAPEGFRDPTPEEWEAVRTKKRPWPYVGVLKDQAEGIWPERERDS